MSESPYRTPATMPAPFDRNKVMRAAGIVYVMFILVCAGIAGYHDVRGAVDQQRVKCEATVAKRSRVTIQEMTPIEAP